MPVRRWMAKVNRRVFNPMEIKRGVRPVLEHVGRRSGTVHRTPLDAHPVDEGFVFIALYGSSTDWVRNVLAAGRAGLSVEGERFELVRPRLIPEDEAWRVLPAGTSRPPKLIRGTQFLRMDIETTESP